MLTERTIVFPRFRIVFALALVTLCVGAAGCGDGGPSEEDRVAEAARLATSTVNPKEGCETLVTARYVREVFGSVAACRRLTKLVQAATAQRDIVRRASSSQTRIKGAKATTAVKLVINRVEVGNGRLALVKQGGDWKLDRLGLDWLRSVFLALPKVEDAPKGSAACIERALRGLTGSALRRAGTAAAGGRAEDVPPRLARCLGVFEAASDRMRFEQGVLAGARKNLTIDQTRAGCIVGRLRDTISDEELERLTADADAPPALARQVQLAILNC